MSDIIFVKPKENVYDSYTDLWRLVELAGYSVVFPEGVKPRSKNTYIIPTWTGEFPDDGWKKPNARIIVWLLEWGIHHRRQGVEYWCPDAWNASVNDARYVPLGGDARLRESEQRGTPIDLIFPAYLTNRRMWVRDRLMEKGITFNHIPDNFESASTLWGGERDIAYNSARAAFHLHQDERYRTLPPLRLVMAAAYRLPFLTETVEDQGVFHGMIITEDYNQLVERVPYWLSQDLSGYADALARYLNETYTFKTSIEDNL